MSVYLITLCVLLPLALLNNYEIRPGFIKKAVGITLFIVFFLISGLRYEVGADYQSYMEIFESDTRSLETIEEGFAMFVDLIRSSGAGFEFAIFIISAVTLFFAYKYIKHFSLYFFFPHLFSSHSVNIFSQLSM